MLRRSALGAQLPSSHSLHPVLPVVSASTNAICRKPRLGCKCGRRSLQTLGHVKIHLMKLAYPQRQSRTPLKVRLFTIMVLP